VLLTGHAVQPVGQRRVKQHLNQDRARKALRRCGCASPARALMNVYYLHKYKTMEVWNRLGHFKNGKHRGGVVTQVGSMGAFNGQAGQSWEKGGGKSIINVADDPGELRRNMASRDRKERNTYCENAGHITCHVVDSLVFHIRYLEDFDRTQCAHKHVSHHGVVVAADCGSIQALVQTAMRYRVCRLPCAALDKTGRVMGLRRWQYSSIYPRCA
jgi:hypothetical protein